MGKIKRYRMTTEERRRASLAQPKCSICGNCLSRDEQDRGIVICPQCEYRDNQPIALDVCRRVLNNTKFWLEHIHDNLNGPELVGLLGEVEEALQSIENNREGK